jgi:hypothetical protein
VYLRAAKTRKKEGEGNKADMEKNRKGEEEHGMQNEE